VTARRSPSHCGNADRGVSTALSVGASTSTPTIWNHIWLASGPPREFDDGLPTSCGRPDVTLQGAQAFSQEWGGDEIVQNDKTLSPIHSDHCRNRRSRGAFYASLELAKRKKLERSEPKRCCVPSLRHLEAGGRVIVVLAQSRGEVAASPPTHAPASSSPLHTGERPSTITSQGALRQPAAGGRHFGTAPLHRDADYAPTYRQSLTPPGPVASVLFQRPHSHDVGVPRALAPGSRTI
jgi:hypothetical protein